MLTGDKVDTAINIGHSCSLLNTDMVALRLCADDNDDADDADDTNGKIDGKTDGKTKGKADGKTDGKNDGNVNSSQQKSNGRDKSGGGSGGGGGGHDDKRAPKSEKTPPEVSQEQHTRLELDPSGVPSEASLRG